MNEQDTQTEVGEIEIADSYMAPSYINRDQAHRIMRHDPGRNENKAQ